MTVHDAIQPAEAETIRRDYLAAMGITQWYARVPLSDGAVAVWSDESAAAPQRTSALAALDSAVETRTRQPQPVVPAPTDEKVIAPEFKVPKSAPKKAEPDANSSAEQGAQENAAPARQQGIEFMQQWWARDGLLIVDTRPKKLPVLQQQAADRLMAAIAFAVGGQAAPQYSNLVDWPLFVNRSIKHDLEEAQFYLQQKWQAVQQPTPITRLLLLGDQSPSLLNCEPTDARRADTSWVWHGVQCLQGPSTSELLHLPGMKRDFWRALQPWLSAHG